MSAHGIYNVRLTYCLVIRTFYFLIFIRVSIDTSFYLLYADIPCIYNPSAESNNLYWTTRGNKAGSLVNYASPDKFW